MSTIASALAISDLHLGRAENYLSTGHEAYARNRHALARVLERLGPRTELVINGDLFELALAPWDAVMRDARAFFELLAEAGRFERIVYIPGNHDHHFWRRLVEEIEILEKMRGGVEPSGPDEYLHCFVDRRYSSRDWQAVDHIVLADLWPRGATPPEIVVKYPHHLVRIAGRDGADGRYFFTHGHFLEDLFRPVNFLIEPAHLEELEAFNTVWLEAFNYHLGHAGRLSDRVKEIVISYERGGVEARSMLERLFAGVWEEVRRRVRVRWPASWLLRAMRRFAHRKLLQLVPRGQEASLHGTRVDESLKESIREYIDKYVIERYREGMAREYRLQRDADIPVPFTFAFGHTHRLIPDAERGNAGVVVRGNRFPIENTGGWLRIDGGLGRNAGVLALDDGGARWESLDGSLE